MEPTRGYGLPESRSGDRYEEEAGPAEAAASLDDLAQPGPRLIEAAALLLDELSQAPVATSAGVHRTPSARRRGRKASGVRQPLFELLVDHPPGVRRLARADQIGPALVQHQHLGELAQGEAYTSR
jgi:hypothetical protein